MRSKKYWLVIYDRTLNNETTLYFNTEFTKDKYRDKIKNDKRKFIVEDSSDINFYGGN